MAGFRHWAEFRFRAWHDQAMPRRHLDLLAIALRARPRTIAELSELAMLDLDTVRRRVEELAAEGYLAVYGEQIHYLAPDEAVAEVVRRRTEDVSNEVSARLAELVDLVAQLPALARDWETGGATHGILDVEVFHGWSAVTDLWHQVTKKQELRRTDVVLPDASRLYVADPEMQTVWHDVVAREGNRARVIANITDTARPEATERIGQELTAGVDIRITADPVSWFWVADGEFVALPLRWGEPWPTSAIALRSPAVAGLAQWVFDELWSAAIPVREEPASWDPLLRLMTRGATLEAASRALGISDRTGRRRIADAMDHFRVTNLFALGAAWGRKNA
jgi:DNA-binding Lrp family transcriptional regulator